MTQTNAKPIVKLEIDALSYGPYGIGRIDGKAVMVPHTAPGDQIEARLVIRRSAMPSAKSSACFAHRAHGKRRPALTSSACGGCSWQHIKYDSAT